MKKLPIVYLVLIITFIGFFTGILSYAAEGEYAQLKKYAVCYQGVNTAADEIFVAEHFDMIGMDKTTYVRAQNIKNRNPNIRILAYFNTIDQVTWYDDWNIVNQTKYESWFVHDKYGSNYYHRVTSTGGTHYLMRPNLGLTPTQQYTSWADYYTKRAKTFLQNYPQYDGIFADEVTWDLAEMGAVFNVPYSSFQSGIIPFEIYWGPKTLQFMQHLQTSLGNKPIVCNAWKWTTFCQNATHMTMWEGFIHRRYSNPTEPGYGPYYAMYAINRLNAQAKLGNTIIVLSGTKNADLYPQQTQKLQKYTLACFLMAVENMEKSYFAWNFYKDDSSKGYFSEMDIEFGNPIADYYHVKNDVYAREFENRTVVVNLNHVNTESVTINGQQYQIGPTTGLFLNKGSNPSSWWNQNWGYRKQITIDHSKVTANLVNFPVLISLTSDSNLVAHAQADGDDIVFTDNIGNKLNHEIELYTSSTGRLIAWVNVPALSSSTDTKLYLYYGNSACSSQQNKPGTWNSNFLMVHHMEETGTVFDSTSNGFTGINYGTSTDSNGKIDGCRYFNSLSDRYDFGNPSLLNPGLSSWTITLWTKINYVSPYHQMMQKWSNANAGFILYLYNGWGGTNYFKVGDGTHTTYRYWSTPWSDGNWHYITIVINRNTNLIDLYVDGNLCNGGGSGSIAGFGSITTSADFLLYGGTVGRHDDFTISKTIRSSSWIKTSYNNQNIPSSFYTLGNQQSIG